MVSISKMSYSTAGTNISPTCAVTQRAGTNVRSS
ncbi:hypothetical protein NPIL_574191, partial [Nephila pilipes]